MCGRYRLARKKQILAETFDVDNDVEWSPRYNVAPGQNVPVIRQDAARPLRSISLARWGLIPFWAKDAKAGYKMINARAETVAGTPAFRDPFRSRRCLIPADAFYEWSKEGKQKSPFCFSMADDSIFAFAGIWDRWRNPDTEWVETCSIITTSANTLLSGIHNRMPVILQREDYDLGSRTQSRRCASAAMRLVLTERYRAGVTIRSQARQRGVQTCISVRLQIMVAVQAYFGPVTAAGT